MTITTLPTRNEYTATAGQTVFTYTFKIFESTDLNVYQTPAGQEADDTTDLITGYTVSGVGDEDGGSITLTTPASSGDLITIVSDIPESRTTDYQNNGDFRPDVVNDDFDRVVSLVKQVNDNIASRTLSFQESQQGSSGLSLPNPDAGRLLRWKGDETGLENVDLATPVEVSISNIASLRNLSESNTYADGTTINVLGYYSNGDKGGGQFYWDSTSVETDNGGTIIKVTTVTTGRWKRLFSKKIDIRYFGAVNDGVTDNITPLQNALSINLDIIIPEGVWNFSQPVSTTSSESDSIIVQGFGEAQTILSFNSTNGVELNSTAYQLRDMSIIDSDSYLTPITTLAEFHSNLPQRANITASTAGLTVARSHIEVHKVQIMGFDTGVFFNTSKFYNDLYNIRSHFNLVGCVVGTLTESPNLARAHSCYFTNNFQKNLHVVNGSFTMRDGSIEGCEDYDSDNPNYPDGGTFIESGGQALFDNLYTEGSNFYNFDRRTKFINNSNSNYIVTFAPMRIDDTKYGNVSKNLILPPHKRSWFPASSAATSITIDNTFLDDDKRYTRLSGIGGAGTDKRIFSHWNTDVRGLKPLNTSNAFFKVYSGMWVRIVSGTFTALYPFIRVQFQDTSSNVYYGEGRTRTHVFGRDAFDNTSTDWQYIGAFYQVRFTFATGVELEKVRLEINLEDTATDCSVTNRVMDIAEPEVRFYYQTPGNLINDVEPVLTDLSTLTIDTGDVQVVDHYHIVDTESASATDDLDNIYGEDLYPGFELVLEAADNGRTVIVKDGTGNLNLAGAGGDFSLNNTADKIKLVWNGTLWNELSRSDNGS